MPNLLAQLQLFSDDVLFQIYLSSQLANRNAQDIITVLTDGFSAVVKATDRVFNQVAQLTIQVDEGFKLMDKRILALTEIVNYKTFPVDVKSSVTLPVSIKSIPTQDAIVVTNNLFHPALAVAFLPAV